MLWVEMYGKVKIQNFTNYYYNRFLTREQVEFQDEYNFFAYREVILRILHREIVKEMAKILPVRTAVQHGKTALANGLVFAYNGGR